MDYASAIERYGNTEANIRGLKNPSQAEITALGKEMVKAKYGNLFDMYKQIAADDPYEMPMKIYPAVHYTMGGLWVDYNLMTAVPGLYAAGEANFSDHGANRLGASALMQGLADGYFVLPYTIGDYLSKDIRTGKISPDSREFKTAEAEVQSRMDHLINNNGTKPVDHFHRRLGRIMWDECGMSRNEEGLKRAIQAIRALREEFWKDVRVPGAINSFNPELDKAGRVADFLEQAELMCLDALERRESCGGHFREEYQTAEGEALRDDDHFAFVSAWEFTGDPGEAKLIKEDLVFENIELKQRSYK